MSTKWKRNDVVSAWNGAANKLHTRGGGDGLKRNISLKIQTQGLVYPAIDIYGRQHTGERCRLSFLRAFFRPYRPWRGVRYVLQCYE